MRVRVESARAACQHSERDNYSESQVRRHAARAKEGHEHAVDHALSGQVQAETKDRTQKSKSNIKEKKSQGGTEGGLQEGEGVESPEKSLALSMRTEGRRGHGHQEGHSPPISLHSASSCDVTSLETGAEAGDKDRRWTLVHQTPSPVRQSKLGRLKDKQVADDRKRSTRKPDGDQGGRRHIQKHRALYPSQCCAFPEGCHLQPNFWTPGSFVRFCSIHRQVPDNMCSLPISNLLPRCKRLSLL